MDPLSAVSIAAASIQFVDFASRLFSKGKEIYKTGTLESNEDILITTEHLLEICRGQSYNTQKVLDGEYPDLLISALKQCEDISTRLIDLANSIKKTSGGKKWSTLKQALKTITKSDEIDSLTSRLSGAREQLILCLLIVSRGENVNQHKDVISSNELMEQKIVDVIRTVGIQTQRDIKQLQKSISTQSLRQSHVWAVQHAEGFGYMSLKLSKAVVDIQIRDVILDSLYFPHMNERYFQVRESDPKTFHWIFENDSNNKNNNKNVSWSNFVSWLQSESGIYWICGKAASGKSTLMKFIHNDPRTKQHLSQWSKSEKLVTAHCFFWAPGNQLQKSMLGLLSTLLRQILSQCDFPSSVCPARWYPYNIGDWTESELRDCLSNVFGLPNIKICLFVDGLDEYHGSDEKKMDLIRLLYRFSESKSVKICVSSRPWLIFQDSFQQEPSLRLEDLTYDDIRTYVDENLIKTPRFRLLKNTNEKGLSQITTEIMTKAQGVFLWVYLVVRSLLEGIRNGDDLDDLLRRLRMMPSDLEDYFKQILSTLDPFYKEQASQFLLFTLVTRHRGLEIYAFLRSNDTFAIVCPISTLSAQEMDGELDKAERRINAACKGLLEVYDRNGILPPRVHFLHRSISDFLESDNMQNLLRSYLSQDFNPYLCLCASLVTSLKKLRFENSVDVRELLYGVEKVAMEAARMEEFQDQTPVQLLDEVVRILKYRWHENSELIVDYYSSPRMKRKFHQHLFFSHPDGNLLMALALGIHQYARFKIHAAGTRLGQPAESGTQPFLLWIDTEQSRNLGGSESRMIMVVKELLDAGVDPNEKFDGETVVKTLIRRLPTRSSPFAGGERDTYGQIFRLFAEKGIRSTEDIIAVENCWPGTFSREQLKAARAKTTVRDPNPKGGQWLRERGIIVKKKRA